MENSLVSICIPIYNGQKFLETCLDSAIGQTYRNIEIIIVDDCSTDNTLDIVDKYVAKDSRVKLFRNEKNIGLVANWNRCIELSAGEWIKFLFQDDVLTSNCIEVMIKALAVNDKIIASGRRLILDKSLDEATKKYSINETLTFERLGIISNSPVYISPRKIASLAVKNISTNFIGEPTVIMFKKEVVEQLGTFNPDIVQICDLEYFLRIACNYGVKYIPQPLTYFRVHKGSASTSNISKRIFSMVKIDPIIMVRQLLYETFFNRFRKSLSLFQKIKLKLFFKIHVHEAYVNSLHSNHENRVKFEIIGEKYPEIAMFRKGSMIIRILLEMVKLKRRSQNRG
jgi:glycosyltransferase involved in cell wall biosynthesis